MLISKCVFPQALISNYFADNIDLGQICPIPASLASEAESTFTVQAQKYGFDLEEVQDPASFHKTAEEDGKGTDYFKVDLPNGKSFVHWIAKDERFGLQFGR